MTLLNTRLTSASYDHLAADTYPGMAHWSGSGPAGMTCRQCAYWDHGNLYHPKRGKYGGRIKAARCRRYKALTGIAGDPVPDDAGACRHFTPAATVPERFAKT